MIYTEHYEFAKPEPRDYYSDYIAAQCDNMDKADAALHTLSQSMGGLTLSLQSAESYAQIAEPDSTTVYFVSDGQTLEIYLGRAKVKGGSSGAVTAAVKFNAAAGQALSLQEKKTEE